MHARQLLITGLVLVAIPAGLRDHAARKVAVIAPQNHAGIRWRSIQFGPHEWLRLDFSVNHGSQQSPRWVDAYHWSLRHDAAWWGCSVD